MSHASEVSKFTPRSKKREKAVANQSMNAKRIKVINDKTCAEKKDNCPR
jgi:hypothetical protein